VTLLLKLHRKRAIGFKFYIGEPIDQDILSKHRQNIIKTTK